MPLVLDQRCLSLSQVGPVKKVAPIAIGVEPLTRPGGEPGVLVTPLKVGLERLQQPDPTRQPDRRRAQEHPFRVGQRLRHDPLVNVPVNDWNDQFVERNRVLKFLAAGLGDNRIGTDDKDQGLAGLDSSFDARSPLGATDDVDIHPHLVPVSVQLGRRRSTTNSLSLREYDRNASYRPASVARGA